MSISHRVGWRFKSPRLKHSSSGASSIFMRPCSGPVRLAVIFLIAVFISCFFLYKSAESLHIVHGSPSILSRIFPSFDSFKSLETEESKLEDVLRKAAMIDNTVILTTLNEAWASPGSVLDLFLESFEIGEGTSMLLNHLVIIALDSKAYSHCQELHKHCFNLETEGVDFSEEAYFMTSSYLKMMWRRISFLRSVLELGYNFVFTDADVMWFRNPFPRFHSSADFQIACDHYSGMSHNLENIANGGFSFVRSNSRTILFYKYWYASRIRYPGNHDQDVLNLIKTEPFIVQMRFRIWFLNTAYFGGLCEPSKDMNVVCTMHANCCFGMENKIHDLKIMLQNWKDYMSLPLDLKQSSDFSWKVPQNCSVDSLGRLDSMEEEEESEATADTILRNENLIL